MKKARDIFSLTLSFMILIAILSVILIAGISIVSAYDTGNPNALTNNQVKRETNDDSTPVHNLNTSENFSTIQAAIDDSDTQNGHIITVEYGIYTENVDVYKSLTISGDPMDTIVQAANSSDHALKVTADYVNIIGFEVENATGYAKAGIYLDSVEHCNVSYNTVSNNYRGIYLEGSSNNVLTNNNVWENEDDGIVVGGDVVGSNNNILTNNKVEGNEDGIILWNSDNNALTNNIVESNREGIVLVSSSNNILTNNIVESWGESWGISLEYSDNNTLVNNTPKDSYGGISLHSSSNNNLTNNRVWRNEFGISLRDSNSNILTNNNVWDNGEGGISLEYSDNNNLANNTANDNGVGIGLWGSSHNILSENNASDNDFYGAGEGGIGILLDASNNNIVTNNTANSNDISGIYVSSYGEASPSSNNIFSNNTLNLNAGYGIHLDLYSKNNIISNNLFYNNYLDFKSSGSLNNILVHNLFRDTWASFNYSGDIEVDSSSAPAGDPSDWYNIRKYLSIVNQTSAWVNLSIHYADYELNGIDESTLRLLKHNGADWVLVPGSSVNTNENVVSANIASFSIFAPFGRMKDLIVEDITWTPTNISDGDNVTFIATIKNNDTGNIFKTFNNTFYLDGSAIGGISVNGLSAGSSIDISRTWTATPGSHIIKVFADSNTDILESNETNNNRSKSLLIEPADLIVDDITWTPTNISDGDTVTFNATIKNNGTGNTSRAFNNTFYLDGSSIGGMAVNGLSAGSSINITQTWTATAGVNAIKVEADSNNAVSESNETNNERSESLPGIGQADLIVMDLTWSPSSIDDGDAVTFNATLKNNGTGGTSREFYVRFEVDSDYIGRRIVSGLDSGSSVEVSQTWIAKGGTDSVKVIADEYNVVAESNEDNNEMVKSLPEISAPDLVVTSITWSPDISDGKEVTINATVENMGAISTPGFFFVRLEVDDKYIGRQQVTHILEAGESAVVSLTWTAMVGTHTVKAIADEYNWVCESNENNNELSQALPEVFFPDLIISELTYTPQENISDGDEVTLNATVENTGVGNTFREFFVRFEVNDSYIGRQKVPGLDAGSIIKVNQTWIAVAGNYTVKTIVDEYDAVTESNEENNELWQVLPDVPYPDLIITNITWSPTEGINDGDEVIINATVHNNGTGNTSREFHVGFKVNDSYIGRQKMSGLDAGRSAEVSQTWITKGGAHTVIAIADEHDTVAESNEANNNRSKSPIQVIKPNLVITDLTWSPEYISDGEEVYFNATVENTGPGNTSRDFYIHFEVDNKSFFFGRQEVAGGLDAGNSTTVTLTKSWVASFGTHTVKALEVDETANELSKIFEVIDDNPPILVSIFPANGSIVKEVSNVTATLSDDHGSGVNLVSSTIVVKQDGITVPGTKTTEGDDKIIFTPTDAFDEGDYTVLITAVDNSSKEGTNLTYFSLDKSYPAISITGVIEGAHYEIPITPIIVATDPYLESFSITLNGRPFESGTTIKVDGIYSLIVKATDKAENTITRSVNFTVDTPPAAPTGLSVTYGDNVAYLSWKANIEPDVAGYNVYRDGTKINDKLIKDTVYQDTNVTAGEEYVYELSAVDEAGHESELGGVTPMDITLVSYGTSVGGEFYLTREFVDLVNVNIANKGSYPIDIDSVKFDLIDSVGKICYSVTHGSFTIEVGGSQTLEKRLLIDKNLTSKLRVTVNQLGGAQVSSTFVVNVRDAPATSIKVSAPTLTEGYADEINLEFTNYGSASLSINPEVIGLYLSNSEGSIITQGVVSGSWRWVEPNATVTLSGFISAGSPHPESLFLNVTLPTYYGDHHGQYKGTEFGADEDASFRYQTLSPIEIYHRPLTQGDIALFTLTFLNQGTAALSINQGDVKVYIRDEDDNIIAQGTSQDAWVAISPKCSEKFLAKVNMPIDFPELIEVEAVVNASCLAVATGVMVFNVSTWEVVTEPEYNATATTDKEVYNLGENVTISGVVVSTEDGEPVPNALVSVEVCSKGFRRQFPIEANSEGYYTYVFKPLAAEAGKYIVGATHPRVTALEVDASFEILGLYMSPQRINLEMSQNSRSVVTVEVKNIGESNLTGIGLEIIDKNETDGVTATCNGEKFDLGPGKSRRLEIEVTAELDTPDETSFEIRADCGQGSVETSTLLVKLYPATPVARIEPYYIQTGLNPGGTQVEAVRITNIGYEEMKNVTIADASLPWISLVTNSNLGNIPPGENRTFDILMQPSEEIEPGEYEDDVKITSSNHRTMAFPMRVIVTSEETGDLRFIVKNQFEEFIPGAEVSIVNQEIYTLTYTGETNSEGEVSFTGIPVGRYSYNLVAPYYDPASGSVVVEVGMEKDVEVYTTYTFLKVEWEVTPTTIEDMYIITHNITYDSKAPLPYVKAEPLSINLYMMPGASYHGNVTLKNMNDIVSVFNLTPKVTACCPTVSVEFLTKNIPELKPGESVTIPYVVKLAEHHSPEVKYCERYLLTFCFDADLVCIYGIYKYEITNKTHVRNIWLPVPTDCVTISIKPACLKCMKKIGTCILDLTLVGGVITLPVKIYDGIGAAVNCYKGLYGCARNLDECIEYVWRNLLKQFIPGIDCVYKIGKDCYECMYGEDCAEKCIAPLPPLLPGESYGYGPHLWILFPRDHHTPSPYLKGPCLLSPETMCIRVKLEIRQELTMERQAFDAMLKLTNIREDYEMTDISVDIDVRDSDGNSANDLFFMNVTSMEGIDSIENGRLDPEGSGTIHWLIIPTPGAGGTEPEGVKYTANAYINYSVKGLLFDFETWPDDITVQPMPTLVLDYMLPRNVYGDDPMTVGIKEPIIPFVWGVRVKNVGYGPARNLAIDSAQPKIVEATKGVHIDFKLLGTWVDGIKTEDTLKINFGDIPPDSYATAGWEMMCSLTGEFTNYTATYKHSDALGGEATSLIGDLRTHLLVHEFINDAYGQDKAFDFLIDSNNDSVPDMIFDSAGTDQSITSVSAEMVGMPSLEEPTVKVVLNKSAGAGWVYAVVDDPLENKYNISKVVRCIDGKILNSRNYWLIDGKIHIVDDPGENYRVTYVLGDTTPPASITYLQNVTGQTWINWTWMNPPDADFCYTMVYLNGTWQANTSNNYYNATGLTPDTKYEIGAHTVDTSGNINTTWVNQTTKTQAGIDSKPPLVTNPTATPQSIVANGILESQLNVTVTDESGIASVTANLSDIGGSHIKEMNNIPGTDVYTVNTTAAVGTAQGTYYLQVNATDSRGNSNTSMSIMLEITRLCGDVAPYPDCNGIVDMGDVILLLNNVSYPENPRYALCNAWAGDCRCNGVLDMGDVILLLNNVSYPEDPRYVLDCC